MNIILPNFVSTKKRTISSSSPWPIIKPLTHQNHNFSESRLVVWLRPSMLESRSGLAVPRFQQKQPVVFGRIKRRIASRFYVLGWGFVWTIRTFWQYLRLNHNMWGWDNIERKNMHQRMTRCFAIIDTGNRPEHKKHPWDISRSSSMVTGNRSLENSHWLMEQPRRVSWETTGSLSRVGVAAPKECSGRAFSVADAHGGLGFLSDGLRYNNWISRFPRNMYVIWLICIYVCFFWEGSTKKQFYRNCFFPFLAFFFTLFHQPSYGFLLQGSWILWLTEWRWLCATS